MQSGTNFNINQIFSALVDAQPDEKKSNTTENPPIAAPDLILPEPPLRARAQVTDEYTPVMSPILEDEKLTTPTEQYRVMEEEQKYPTNEPTMQQNMMYQAMMQQAIMQEEKMVENPVPHRSSREFKASNRNPANPNFQGFIAINFGQEGYVTDPESLASSIASAQELNNNLRISSENFASPGQVSEAESSASTSRLNGTRSANALTFTFKSATTELPSEIKADADSQLRRSQSENTLRIR